MYIQIGKGRMVRTRSIIAVVPENGTDRETGPVRSLVYTDKSVIGSPLRVRAILKKIEEGRL